MSQWLTPGVLRSWRRGWRVAHLRIVRQIGALRGRHRTTELLVGWWSWERGGPRCSGPAQPRAEVRRAGPCARCATRPRHDRQTRRLSALASERRGAVPMEARAATTASSNTQAFLLDAGRADVRKTYRYVPGACHGGLGGGGIAEEDGGDPVGGECAAHRAVSGGTRRQPATGACKNRSGCGPRNGGARIACEDRSAEYDEIERLVHALRTGKEQSVAVA